MNSHVSVGEQDDEVSWDEFDSFVFSASNFSESSVDSDKSEKGPNFFNKAFLSVSPGNFAAASDDLVLCMADGKADEKQKATKGNTRTSRIRPNRRKCTKDSRTSINDPKFVFQTDVSNPVDFSCLPLEKLNYPEGNEHQPQSESELDTNIARKLFESESESDSYSFDGFSDDSNSSFEGFLNKPSTYFEGFLNKPSTYFERCKETSTLSSDSESPTRSSPSSVIKEHSDSFGKYRVNYQFSSANSGIVSTTATEIGSSTKFLRSHQNYSKSLVSSLCSSAPQEFEKEANASRTICQKSKKENLKMKSVNQPVTEKLEFDHNKNNLNNSRARYKLNLEQQVIENLQSISFSDDSENESFEGFDFKKDKELLDNRIDNRLIADNIADNKGMLHNISVNDEAIGNEGSVNLDKNDFIGDFCNQIGCTISWLESDTTKTNTKPSKITNGVVYELSEFAKKIAWEPIYVAFWILRLRGYINIPVQNEDMKKINSVIKRRKALSVTFAGYTNLKGKLSFFDSQIFSLPSLEKLDIINKDSLDRPKLGKALVRKIEESVHCSNKASKGEGHTERTGSNYTKTNEIEATDKSKILQNITCSEEVENNTALHENAKYLENLDLSDSEIFFSDDESYILDKDNSSNSESEMFDLPEESHSGVGFSQNENKSKFFYLANYTDTAESYSSQIVAKSSKGRIRKPTVKAKESYSLKRSCQANTSSSEESFINKSPLKDVPQIPSENFREKLLHPTFPEDIKVIGPYCKASGIDLKLMNSFHKANSTITNGVVYELYHFFRERKASLTSLVHTLYRLKDIPIDKSHIIATMAKIHEMVKVMWDENVNKNPGMPCEEFHLPEQHSKEVKNLKGHIDKDVPLEVNNQLENLEPQSKKLKLDNGSPKSLSKAVSPEKVDITPDLSDSNCNSRPSYTEPKESGPMSNTFGYEGKITRGDIVYLYTKWLKKKMESQSNVFVTDLSKEVEDLITNRKVEFIRIPVGTLMSSSVKLFEEFRKLSKCNMYEAKAYLLEDWIEDIKSILVCNKKNNSNPNSGEDREIPKSRVPYISVSKDSEYSDKDPNTDIASIEDRPHSSDLDFCSDNDPGCSPKRSKLVISEVPHPLIKNVAHDYKVEKIVGYRIVKIGQENITEYRIRWADLSSKEDSWINEADLNCPDILAKFWEALIKQRALRGKSDAIPGPVAAAKEKLPVNVIKEQTPIMSLIKKKSSVDLAVTEQISASSFVKEKSPIPKTVLQGQENICPFFGRENSSSPKFFNLLVDSLKPSLVDYQHEEEKLFAKRVKITKGEVLSIYNNWRYENQEHLLTGGNQKVDLSVLISRVKDLMERKRVRNFNPSCLLDVCYRMSLMEAKLKDAEKVDEYLSGDFLELMQIGQKHQNFVRRENASFLKKLKQSKMTIPTENQKLIEKINLLNNLERESLIIGRFLQENRSSSNLEKDLENEISVMKKVLEVKQDETINVESLKRQNPNTIKELESFGVKEDILDEILHIALKIN